MEAHINNEIQFSVRGLYSNYRLVHIVITNSCLQSCHINISALDDHCESPTVYFQTRKHGNAACSTWSLAEARYVRKNAATTILIPSIPGHSGVFKSTGEDDGGVFLTAWLESDVNGNVDPFDIIVFRFYVIERNSCFPTYADIPFLYEELVMPGTRYDADGDRLILLCLQLSSYLAKKRRNLGSWAIEARSKISSIVNKILEDEPEKRKHYRVKPINVSRIISARQTFDQSQSPKQNIVTQNPDDIIGSLLKRATEAVEKVTRVVPKTNQSPRDGQNTINNNRAVVSGLKQGAMAYMEKSKKSRFGPTERDVTATIAGLEPAGYGRFVGGTAAMREAVNRSRSPPNATAALEDILIFDGRSEGPETLIDIFDMAFINLSGGDSQADNWRRRPISITVRAHMFTGKQFYAVSYENSMAVGGRSLRANTTTVTSPWKKITTVCLDYGTDSPRDLPTTELEKLASEFPHMRVVLFKAAEIRGASSLVSSSFVEYFSVSCEVNIKVKFSQACVNAVRSALGAAIRSKPKPRQVIAYDTTILDENSLAVIAARIPALLRAFAESLILDRGEKFFNGALVNACITFLSRNIHENNKCTRPNKDGSYFWPITNTTANDIFGRFFTSDPSDLSVSTADKLIFDYFSTSGECIRVSKRPIPVLLGYTEPGEGTQREERYKDISKIFSDIHDYRGPITYNTCLPCAFPKWFSDTQKETTCEHYLPGQSFSYLCIGFNSKFEGTIVFPGGYVLNINPATYLDISAENARVVLNRILDREC